MTDLDNAPAEQGEGHTPGQFCVFRRWRWVSEEITRVTHLMVFTRSVHGRGENRHDKISVVYSGSETEAKALCGVLTQLEARYLEASRQVNRQHKERVSAAIARAQGSAK